MKEGISKKQSSIIYGIAIIFMVYHHLFCIPSRIVYDYFSVLDFLFPINGVSVERTLAWFFKLCVALFAFITGYGIARKLPSSVNGDPFKVLFYSYIDIIKTILKLMFKLVLVIIVFVPLYYFIKEQTFSFVEIIKNIIGLSSSICGEWWYVGFYFFACSILPLFNLLFSNGYKKIISRILISILVLLIFGTIIYFNYASLNYVYFCIVFEGFLISRFKIFELIYNKIPYKLNIIISIILLLICIVTRILLATSASYNSIDMAIIAPFIYSILVLIKEDSFVGRSLIYLGKHSTYIWLTHTLFAYSLFTRFITISSISTIIFLENFIVALLASYIFMFVEKSIYKLVKKLFSRKKDKSIEKANN